MTSTSNTGSLAARWQYEAGQLHARANQLGNCTAGLVKATEAGAIRQCAQQLEAAPLAERAPEAVRDAEALNAIQAMLNDPGYDGDFTEDIVIILRGIGRQVVGQTPWRH